MVDEHVAGASTDLDLQSKVFDQILSMPIGTPTTQQNAHANGSKRDSEPNSANLLAPCRQPTDGPNLDLNFVDNKEILSFQSKPANMSMSIENESDSK